MPSDQQEAAINACPTCGCSCGRCAWDHSQGSHSRACHDNIWGRSATTIPVWLVKFDCGHTRQPERCYCGGDDVGHGPHDGPPPAGWAGWCDLCKDFRTTVDVIEAAPTSSGRSEVSDGQ